MICESNAKCPYCGAMLCFEDNEEPDGLGFCGSDGRDVCPHVALAMTTNATWYVDPNDDEDSGADLEEISYLHPAAFHPAATKIDSDNHQRLIKLFTERLFGKKRLGIRPSRYPFSDNGTRLRTYLDSA